MEENESVQRKIEKQKRKNEKLLKILIIISTLVAIIVLINIRIIYDMGNRSVVHKPIIYLYPEGETQIEVKFMKPEKLTCTYPKYENSWITIAQPNGDLVDSKTGRSLYALYWEGKSDIKCDMKEGFIVKGTESIKFLEEKLKILGLSEREANEFIIYWLPKLESNKYNYIRFATQEEINEDMPIEITPKPDTLIRVLMQYKELSNPIEIKEQKLDTPERNGYVAVEWGGTELK